MTTPPKISIVIPTYNRAHFLVDTIESVLRQTYDEYEVIVSDNASDDTTWETISRYKDHPKVRLFRNTTNIGMVNNWRTCVEQRISGEWFIILSDDDIFMSSDYLAKVAKLIREYPSIGMIYANGYLIDTQLEFVDRLFIPHKTVTPGEKVIQSYGTVLTQNFTLCNIVFNRGYALKEDCFLNPDNLSCDENLFLRMALRHDVGIVHDCVSIYRLHSNSLTGQIHTVPLVHFYQVCNLLETWKQLGKTSPKNAHKFLRNNRILHRVQNLLLQINKANQFDLLNSLKSNYPTIYQDASRLRFTKIRYWISRFKMKCLKYLHYPKQAITFRLFRRLFFTRINKLISHS